MPKLLVLFAAASVASALVVPAPPPSADGTTVGVDSRVTRNT